MTATCNVVVLISGSGSNLQALIDSLGEGNPACIGAVISNRADAFGLQRAQAAGIATHVVQHRDFADREAFAPRSGRKIRGGGCAGQRQLDLIGRRRSEMDDASAVVG